ncbi:MAG: peroxiredoxin [Isosphaeraceae bacterium]|jgi:uncharacterized OsmC-like protein|nr:MAG: peroxiredoxin [Isosphaeraceae bacterium]
MNADQLRALQAPWKERYRNDPAQARQTLHATGCLASDGPGCTVTTPTGPVGCGLHPATGGDGSSACAAELLLQALAACAGVTLTAVATALGIPLRSGTVHVDGDLDFRGTLGVDKTAPVGFTAIRIRYLLDSDADDAQLAKLTELTERYCVVYQTLCHAPSLSATWQRTG